MSIKTNSSYSVIVKSIMVCMLYKCCKTKQLIACIFEYQVPYPCQVLNTSTRILQRFITSLHKCSLLSKCPLEIMQSKYV